MENSKVAHRFIRRLASWAVWSFFTEVHVIGGENVPAHGPIIVTATHHNMMLDPAILSVAFPHARIMHYWSKASLFANPVMSYVLYSSGNIPVDRKSKDRSGLFKGTIEALAKGFAVALFPEGTSYTEPRIMQVKDGAAWAAMEYTNWNKANKATEDVVIVPAAIVYTNKSKYRSNVILEFGTPIKMDSFKDEFCSDTEGVPRTAVKRLTKTIETELVEATINAPDWDTLYAARMARDLLWENDKSINLDDFVCISQTLVDLFSSPDAVPNFTAAKRRLLTYYSLLQSTNLSHSVLSTLPLPRSFDPNHSTTLPGRILTLFVLIRDSLSVLIRLPFFLFPLIVHFPVYIFGRLGAKLVEDEEETQAQNKVVLGLAALLLMVYPATFYFIWALFRYTPIGAAISFGTVWLFAIYHNQIINDNYERAKRLLTAWRVLVSVWGPTKWELPSTALSQYTTPKTPKESEWIDKPKTPQIKGTVPKFVESATAAASASSSTNATGSSITTQEPPVSSQKISRPPSRRIMRHVLRARGEATSALAEFMVQLEAAPGGKRVKASPHLARAYKGGVDVVKDEDGHDVQEGWRYAREVVGFLRARGAKIATLRKEVEGEWAAALSSDGELSSPGE